MIFMHVLDLGNLSSSRRYSLRFKKIPDGMWFLFVTVAFVCLVAAERDEYLGIELLQMEMRFKSIGTDNGHCLRFMHIPKTGGTSIDAANMHQSVAPYGSLMRDTYERIATARHFDGDIESFVKETLQEAKERPYENNCFLVPQVEFVYGSRNWSHATQQYCTRFLHQENLTAEFDELMMEIGRPEVKLPEEELLSSWSGCSNMSTSDLTLATRKAIYEFYKEDYEAFGYPPPKLTWTNYRSMAKCCSRKKVPFETYLWDAVVLKEDQWFWKTHL